MDYILTEDFIEKVLNGEAYTKPVVQVLGIKMLTGNSDDSESARWRLMLSDGKHSYSYVMLEKKLNGIIADLSDYAVVRIENYCTSSLKKHDKTNTLGIIIKKMTILVPGIDIGKKLGKPRAWNKASSRRLPTAGSNQSTDPGPSLMKTKPLAATDSFTPYSVAGPSEDQFANPGPSLMKTRSLDATYSSTPYSVAGPSDNQSTNPGLSLMKTRPQAATASSTPLLVVGPSDNQSSNAAQSAIKTSPKATIAFNSTLPILDSNLNQKDEEEIVPIANLRVGPNDTNWVIKARVIYKSSKIAYSKNNQRFILHLKDVSGEIKVKAFSNSMNLYDVIQAGKSYFISKCSIREAYDKSDSLNHDYEIIFQSKTVVKECTAEQAIIPAVKYNFVPIRDIANLSVFSHVDAIGICILASDVEEVTVRNNGKVLKKREVTIVDDTFSPITVTLWGDEAEKFDASNNPIIAVKNAQLGEFNGTKRLSCVKDIQINPDLVEAGRLRDWYYRNRGYFLRNIVQSRRNNTWITFSEAKQRNLGAGDKKDYYTLLGVITITYAVGAVYKACPQESCNKKLVLLENDQYLCEKCDRNYENYKYKMRIDIIVSDVSGEQRINGFNEVAESMLGKRANDVGYLLEHDRTEYARLFDELLYKTFVFNLKTKTETFNNESRLQTTVMSAAPVDYKEANAKLVRSIKALSGIKI